eukprot:m.115410 g.115410  ORF g.115410 m.115410 type:complete len:306 (+) comp21562_c0_seq7:380-1297(+)
MQALKHVRSRLCCKKHCNHAHPNRITTHMNGTSRGPSLLSLVASHDWSAGTVNSTDSFRRMEHRRALAHDHCCHGRIGVIGNALVGPEQLSSVARSRSWCLHCQVGALVYLPHDPSQKERSLATSQDNQRPRPHLLLLDCVCMMVTFCIGSSRQCSDCVQDRTRRSILPRLTACLPFGLKMLWRLPMSRRRKCWPMWCKRGAMSGRCSFERQQIFVGGMSSSCATFGPKRLGRTLSILGALADATSQKMRVALSTEPDLLLTSSAVQTTKVSHQQNLQHVRCAAFMCCTMIYDCRVARVRVCMRV